MATGVTDFIQISDVRHEIDSTYPNPGANTTGDLQVPNNGYSHKLIGHAFEFLCKAWLYRHSDDVIVPTRHASTDIQSDDEEGWARHERIAAFPDLTVSVIDGKKWEQGDGGPSNQQEWQERNAERPDWDQRSPHEWTVDDELTKLANQYVHTGMNTDGVVKAALLNAGWQPADDVQSWINRNAFEADLLSEMSELFSLLRQQDWGDPTVTFEKPRFGNFRHILPGEGDFLIDDLLVDIKTTEKPVFTDAYWRQLLLYYVLNDIQRTLHDAPNVSRSGHEAFDDKYPEITRIGIYFARHGDLQTIDIDDVITDLDRYEEFRAWIVDRAIEENQHAQINYTAIRDILTDPYDYKRQQSLFDY